VRKQDERRVAFGEIERHACGSEPELRIDRGAINVLGAGAKVRGATASRTSLGG
jgi:hypothetical protein